MQIFARIVTCVLLANSAVLAIGQQKWIDRTGNFQVTADLAAFNNDLVIVKTADGELLSIAVQDLSDASQELLKSEEALAVHRNAGLQKWTLNNGLHFFGQLVSHGVKDITLQRRRGKLYLNDRPVENLPAEYRKMLPAVVGHFESQSFSDLAAMEKWFYSRHGYRPVSYHCEGVRIAMKNGDEFMFPYFLFTDADRKFLERGGEEFRKSNAEEQEKQALYMQVRAAEYQKAQAAEKAEENRQRERQVDQQIKRVQLGLLAVNAGVTDLWEVALIPAGGSIYQSQLVVVPAQDSRQASELALAKWPGYSVGPVRRVNRNR